MDWLTFTTELVKGLAWPAVVLVLFFALPQPVSELIPLVRKLKYKDFEAQFGDRLEQAASIEAEVPSALPAPAAPQPPPDQQPAALSWRVFTTDAMPLALQLAEKSPQAAILEAWLGVESAAKTAVNRLKLVAITPRSFLDVVRILDKTKALDSAQIAVLHELRSLRNEVAHVADMALSTETALKYVSLAQSLRNQLDALGR